MAWRSFGWSARCPCRRPQCDAFPILAVRLEIGRTSMARHAMACWSVGKRVYRMAHRTPKDVGGRCRTSKWPTPPRGVSVRCVPDPDCVERHDGGSRRTPGPRGLASSKCGQVRREADRSKGDPPRRKTAAERQNGGVPASAGSHRHAERRVVCWEDRGSQCTERCTAMLRRPRSGGASKDVSVASSPVGQWCAERRGQCHGCRLQADFTRPLRHNVTARTWCAAPPPG